MQHNCISKLPASMQTLLKLEVVRLNSNKLSDFPPLLWKMIGVTTLDLGDNQFQQLPFTDGDLDVLQLTGDWAINISMLSNLQWFSIANNALTNWPPGLELCLKLQHLNLSGNKMQALCPEFSNLVQLTHLDVSKNQLEALPDAIGECISLVYLNVAKNNLVELPHNMSSMQKLKQLYVHENELCSFPTQILELNQLEYIAIHQNKIREVPIDFWRLSSTNFINFKMCRLSIIPDQMFGHDGHADDESPSAVALPIEIASFSNNELKSFPDIFAFIGETLTSLDLSNNKLTSIPNSITACTAIRTLNLEKNEIAVLPGSNFENMKGV